jgi:predicted metal-dependent phosphoesterase TrpH
MLKFTRNKLVNIIKKDPDTLLVHGVLDDDLYGLEMDISVRLSDLKLLSVLGRWNRWTTPECPKSLSFLSQAEGFCIEEKGLEQKIQKTIGRSACRHFATLLIECCDSVKEAVRIIQWEEARVKGAELTFEEFLSSGLQNFSEPGITCHDNIRTSRIQDPPEPIRVLERTKRGDPVPDSASIRMIIDIHTHSHPASSCSSVSEDRLIEEAKRIGLDGICLTDHNYVWDPDRVKELNQKHGFLVLRGNEITTDQGHMLVFGLDTNISERGIVKLDELSREVKKADGFMIVVHPFRGFLTFGVGQLGLTLEKAIQRPLFKYVDAVEVMNGKVTKEENDFASKVAAGLGLPGIGGSDAHTASEVGLYATRFQNYIKGEKDLTDMLKSGRFSPVSFRKDRGAA